MLSDDEAEALRLAAAREGVTVSEWVRRSLREAGRSRASGDVEQRLATIRAAYEHSFPTADIEDMLAEIERGYT